MQLRMPDDVPIMDGEAGYIACRPPSASPLPAMMSSLFYLLKTDKPDLVRRF